ncbi:glycoside hydrolase family 76 protein [Brachybacterium sp. GCM10030267]|uniref:glycoside hydrolase family 76 protein n=1 Tax=Brachybacterium sp. GCM10030267 TaxID=3273381 RepID=UPI00361F6837
MITDTAVWNDHAQLAQSSLDRLFGTDRPGHLENAHPAGSIGGDTFNYWWLAHVMDCRLDAYERTGDHRWTEAAREVRDEIVARNGGSLVNDYFDDMLWFALALVRLFDATGNQQDLTDAEFLVDHVIEHGWNDTLGESLAWRKQQLDYKNSPANGPLIILALRLAARIPAQDAQLAAYAGTAMDWWERTLVAVDGFVEDGINRAGDGRIDVQWRFTYNQGLYLGACVEWFRRTGEGDYLVRARRTARTAIAELSDGSVFRAEGNGGDEGLFKGIFYRYLGLLIEALPEADDDRRAFEDFVRRGTDALVASARREDELLRAGNDWTLREDGPIHYSTQLSAMKALEQRWRIEARAA